MFLIDLLGALLTLLTLSLLTGAGFLLAVLLLGEEAERDPLALAVATLLLAVTSGTAIALALGVLGTLRIGNALPLLAGLVLAILLALRRRPSSRLRNAASGLRQRSRALIAAHPALALVALHAGGSEILRGLLRPPLAWDALMYHLMLAASFLQQGSLAPVFGAIPLNYYGYAPANGSLWLWWWMAPSHTELWVNSAFVPHWLLLGLATGAVARELGAARCWPLAAFLALLTPTATRFLATQYVDLPTAAALVAATCFGLRWLRRPTAAHALCWGAGLGLAAGTKVLGAPYALLLGITLLLATRYGWRQRIPQVLVALAVAAPLAGTFYLRNLALGTDPLALGCETAARSLATFVPGGATAGDADTAFLPRPGSVLDSGTEMLAGGQLPDALLGSTDPHTRELGIGPPVLVLGLVALAAPFLVAGAGARWRLGMVVGGQIWFELAFWLAVPYARGGHVYGNVRYLLPAIALALAIAVAVLDRRDVDRRWALGLALAFGLQGMLQLHTELPLAARVGIAVVDLVAVALALSRRLRATLASRWPLLLPGVIVAGLLAAPMLAGFRTTDRARAFERETTLHATRAPIYARAWGWLDAHAGDGAVAVVGAPYTPFVYPAMGPRLEREVLYVNINRADHPLAIQYPGCDPRVDPDAGAWITNLTAHSVRWVHLSHLPGAPFPIEDAWASAAPALFVLRYSDPNNRIYEVRSPASADGPPLEPRTP